MSQTACANSSVLRTIAPRRVGIRGRVYADVTWRRSVCWATLQSWTAAPRPGGESLPRSRCAMSDPRSRRGRLGSRAMAEIDWERIARAHTHPLQLQILQLLTDLP